jgi:succinoglycan biosynthesis protein ExoU
LSGRHATSDLAALLAFDRAFAQSATLTPEARAALARHSRQLAIKLGYRSFLDTKRARGLSRALIEALQDIRTLPGIAAALLRDKLSPTPHVPAAMVEEPRYLFS